MLEIHEKDKNGFIIINLSGRIDGLTSNEINNYITNIFEKGNRKIILDFSGINYLSSVGLRILLVNQQKVKTAGGDMAIFGLTNSIKDIFRMSGFLKIFTIIENLDDYIGISVREEDKSKRFYETEQLKFEILSFPVTYSKIELIGDASKTENSNYTEDDLVIIDAGKTGLSIGLGAIGNEWDVISSYFGECLTINNSMFYYPAVKRPAVDFMIYSEDFSELKYSYLNGIKTNGNYSYKVSFESKDKPVEVNDLLTKISEIVHLDLFAFNILTESKGIRGMNLKNIPVKTNKPANGKAVFDSSNFSDWVNFPVELQDFNSILAGSGFYISPKRDRNELLLKVFGPESNFHLHTAIFEKALFGFKPENFENELERIFNELHASKVQHILGNSLFSSGTMAIIGLEA